MEKELVDKIVEKKYIELTTTEREVLKDWFTSEEEFDQMKAVFSAVEHMKTEQTFVPKAETKSSLDDLFAQKHAKIAPVIWYNSVLVALYPTDKPLARRPLMQIAAIGLVLLLVYPFLSTEKLMEDQKQLAKVEEGKEAKEKPNEKEEVLKESPQEKSSPVETKTTDESLMEEISVDAITVDAVSSARVAQPSTALPSSIGATDFRAEKFDHPDGVFMGKSAVSYSQAASAQPAIFDLLTAAF